MLPACLIVSSYLSLNHSLDMAAYWVMEDTVNVSFWQPCKHPSQADSGHLDLVDVHTYNSK